jgi:hypothetical protein
MDELVLKKKRLSKHIKKEIVNLNIREADAAYMIKNLLWGKTKGEVLELVKREDLPMAILIFAHKLLKDFKDGKVTDSMNLMLWAFDKTEKKQSNDIDMDDDSLDEEIQKLLDKK